MDATELKERAKPHILQICEHLFPAGKRSGREYVVGNTAGDKGSSMAVRLSGPNIGAWMDFATGNEKGGPIDLWMAAKNISFLDACKELQAYLGLEPSGYLVGKTLEFKPIPAPETNKSKVTFDYLTNTRRISPATAQVYDIKTDGDYLVFPSYRQGQLVRVKKIHRDHRNVDKTKAMWTEGNNPRTLFGWQAIGKDDRFVCICEGEIDALTLFEYGVPALSVPNGAGGGAKQDWIENDFDLLCQFETIYLVFDQDDAGQSTIPEVARRLGRHRCKVVALPYKDPNECLQRGVTPEEMYACVMERSVDTVPPEIAKPSSFTDEIITWIRGGDEAKGPRFPWAEGYQKIFFGPAQLSLWAGYNGHGKSELIGHTMLEFMDMGHGVCIASLELPAKVLLKRLLHQSTMQDAWSDVYLAKTLQWMDGKLWIYNHRGAVQLDKLLDAFKYVRRRYSVNHFVIDSLMKLGLETDAYNDQKRLVEELTNFAHDQECHIHLVVHPNKRETEEKTPEKLNIAGAGDITNMADQIISVWRNRPKEKEIAAGNYDEVKSAPDVIVSVVKNRHEGWEGPINLWFDTKSKQYRPRLDAPLKRYVEMSNDYQ